ncbi:hypothetical protein PsorP6_006599 [Peronosclerospora sorghi]|uniref:Uncharacterized protein n=1 Tax=Peronosclerospora sorghi TaxID=230839 RepID=A0ACC0W884_9STRA|nr:hypothetical protein PsorP6_006599 [Peronosclerospora sorghi]
MSALLKESTRGQQQLLLPCCGPLLPLLLLLYMGSDGERAVERKGGGPRLSESLNDILFTVYSTPYAWRAIVDSTAKTNERRILDVSCNQSGGERKLKNEELQ